MSISKFTEDISHVSKLSDYPSEQEMSAGALKQCFDRAAVQIQGYLNDTLTTELDDRLAELGGQTACDGETVVRKGGTLSLRGKETAVTSSFFGRAASGEFGFFIPEAIQGPAGPQGEPGPPGADAVPKQISTLVVAAADWQGGEAPYSYFHPMQGLGEKSIVTVTPQVEKENILAVGEAMVLAEQVPGGLEFLALTDKPTRDLAYTIIKEN